MARRRRGRAINGILVLDKPQGRTSNAVLQSVKAVFFAAKAGHTGSLDPLATGVLPICFGEATKFSHYLLNADKAYRVTVAFGRRTATGDAEGEVVEQREASALTESRVVQALTGFRGEIEQIPSMYSAIKKDGTPLYELARQGIEVERDARQVMIHENRLEAFRGGEHPEADLYIHCSKGTYIRSIAEDLGEALGCGGHVSALRRVAAGPFDESQAVPLAELEAMKQRDALADMDALLQPVDAALEHLPQVVLAENAGFFLRQGQPVQVPQSPTEGTVSLRMEDGVFLGVGEILDDGRVAPRRLVSMQ